MQAPGSTTQVLRQLVTLFALKALEADMGWLLTEEILSLQAGRQIPNEIRRVHPCCLICAAAPTGTPGSPFSQQDVSGSAVHLPDNASDECGCSALSALPSTCSIGAASEEVTLAGSCIRSWNRALL